MLPDLAGFEAVRLLEHERRTRHTPVIVVASGESLAREEALRLTGTGEPGDGPSREELALTMHELLRRRSARAVRIAARSLSYDR